jgi:hypothetical protein
VEAPRQEAAHQQSRRATISRGTHSCKVVGRSVARACQIPSQRTEEDYIKAASTGLDRIGAPINYRMSRKALKALTKSNIKQFEANLAVAIQAELEALSFSCFWSQRDAYHIDSLFAPHLEAAGIPTEIGVTQPIFHHSMKTVINPGKVIAHGGIIATNVVSNKSLPLVS